MISEVEKIVYTEPNCTVAEPVPVPVLEAEPIIIEEEEGKRKSKGGRNKDNVDTCTYTLYTPAYDYQKYGLDY